MTPVCFPTIPTAPVTQVFNNFNPALYGGDRRHKGIDYGIIAGTAVFACMPGVVTVAINGQTGYGRNVRILHPDGSLSIYGHLSRLMVKAGDEVPAGKQIGESGGDPHDKIDGDGLSTGAHLHWEIRPPGLHASDQTAVDPMLYCLQYLPGALQVAEVIAAALNVRAEPSAASHRIGSVQRKEILHIMEQSNGWGRIHSLRPEWVSLAHVRMTGEPPAQTAPALMPEPTEAEKLARLWNAHPELH